MKEQYQDGLRMHPIKPKGIKDSFNLRECSRCSQLYTPTGSKQRWCKACNSTPRSASLLARYGLNEQDVEELIVAQNGHCALCDGSPTIVDHDHITGAIRGILCYSCNLKLAGLDDHEWKQKAEVYRALSLREAA